MSQNQNSQSSVDARLERRERELEMMRQLGDQIVSELSLDLLLPLIADMARELLDAKTLVIPILDSKSETYTYLAANGVNAARIIGQTFPVGVGMCGWVLENSKPLIFGEGNEWLMGKRTVWEEGRESSLLVPLIARGKIVGGISGLGKADGSSYTNYDLELLTQFANHTSVAVANAMLFDELNQKHEELEDLVRQVGYEKEYAEVTLNAISDGVVTASLEGIVQTMNPVAQRMLGISIDHARGQRIDDIMSIRNEFSHRLVENPLYGAFRYSSMLHLSDDVVIHCDNCSEFTAELSASVMRDAQQKVIGGVLVFKDITESQDLTREIQYQASHDSLTELLNRREFEERLEHSLIGAQKHKHVHAFCYLDLDQFKVVNDTCGHTAGDQLLIQVAALLKKRTRERDTLARLGGDEFGLLLENCPIERAVDIAELIRKDIEEYRFHWENRVFSIGVSIGVVCVNEFSVSQGELFSEVDAATFAAKDAGRNQVRIFDQGDEELALRRIEMEWISRLRDALDHERFTCYLQPIVGIGNDHQNPEYYEVLLRLRDEDGGILAPGAFLPAAERFGLMPEIDKWVIRHIVKRLAAANEDSRFGRYLAVNLSGLSLTTEGFLEFIINELESAQVPFNRLCFEITETAFISNMSKAIEFVSCLRERGCFLRWTILVVEWHRLLI